MDRPVKTRPGQIGIVGQRQEAQCTWETPHPPTSSLYLTLKALSQYSGIPYKTLRRWVSEGILPAYQPVPGGNILVRRDDFEAWMEQRRIPVPTPVAGDLAKFLPLT